jgi:hypothetical protein
MKQKRKEIVGSTNQKWKGRVVEKRLKDSDLIATSSALCTGIMSAELKGAGSPS